MKLDRRQALKILAAVCTAPLAIRASVSAQSPRVIRITARRFTYTPNTITLKKDVPVVLELTTKDVLMGFSVPDFNVRSDIVPGKIARVPLTPHKTGTFVFLCDIFCGSGHEQMNGQIVVAE